MTQDTVNDEPTVSDTLRALAHPVRREILKHLRARGPATATELGEQIGESPANCSFHLRSLARGGLIEETGDVKGRNRPWRARSGSFGFELADLAPEDRAVAKAVADADTRDAFDAILRFQSASESYPEDWQRASFGMASRTRLSPSELNDISGRIRDILAPYQQRSRQPVDAVPVSFFAWGFPDAGPESDAGR